MTAPETEVMGINDRVQLAAAENIFQRRMRERAMRGGATLIAPETVFLSHDTRLGADVTIEPHVVFGPGVTVEGPAVIHAFSHLEGAKVAAGASVGPYARLRPGAVIGPKARVGNFVEIKNASSARVRRPTTSLMWATPPWGRGPIWGRDHHLQLRRLREIPHGHRRERLRRLQLGPRRAGDDRRGCLCRSGSVVTKEVPADALAVARGRQAVYEDWAAKFRAIKAKSKA